MMCLHWKYSLEILGNSLFFMQSWLFFLFSNHDYFKVLYGYIRYMYIKHGNLTAVCSC